MIARPTCRIGRPRLVAAQAPTPAPKNEPDGQRGEVADRPRSATCRARPAGRSPSRDRRRPRSRRTPAGTPGRRRTTACAARSSRPAAYARTAAGRAAGRRTRRAPGTAAASTPQTHIGQPSVRPSTSGNTIMKLAVASSSVPTRSSRVPAWVGRDRGSTRTPDGEGGEAERHVEQEQRAPPGAEHVGLEQQPGDDRTHHRGQADRRTHRRERLRDPVARGTARGSGRSTAAP